MATYISKIKAYIGTDVDFLTDVIVRDDGDGVYISEWNITSKPKPTDEQLDACETEAQAIDAQIEYVQNRVAQYPSIGDQLDALFHAGVFPEELAAQIQAVKDAHPKPE